MQILTKTVSHSIASFFLSFPFLFSFLLFSPLFLKQTVKDPSITVESVERVTINLCYILSFDCPWMRAGSMVGDFKFDYVDSSLNFIMSQWLASTLFPLFPLSSSLLSFSLLLSHKIMHAFFSF